MFPKNFSRVGSSLTPKPPLREGVFLWAALQSLLWGWTCLDPIEQSWTSPGGHSYKFYSAYNRVSLTHPDRVFLLRNRLSFRPQDTLPSVDSEQNIAFQNS